MTALDATPIDVAQLHDNFPTVISTEQLAEWQKFQTDLDKLVALRANITIAATWLGVQTQFQKTWDVDL